MLGQGGTLAQAQMKAHAVLDGVLHTQASMIAFEKVFLTMGITFVCALPLLFLLRTGRPRGAAAAH
jgi:hypothetical protein